MKNLLKKTVRRAACSCALVVGLAGAGMAQDELPTHPDFEKARLVQETEKDLGTALQMFTEIFQNEELSQGLRSRAALHMGYILRSQGKGEEARQYFLEALKGGPLLQGLAEPALVAVDVDVERQVELRSQAEAVLVRLKSRIRSEAIRQNRSLNVMTEESPAATEDLVWLGGAAVPVLRAELNKQLATLETLKNSPKKEVFKTELAKEELGAQVYARTLQGYAALLSNTLWRIGTPEALAFLEELAQSASIDAQRAALIGIYGKYPLSKPALEAVGRLLLSPSLEEEVLAVASKTIGRSHLKSLPVLQQMQPGQVVALLEGGREPLRLEILNWLGHAAPYQFAEQAEGLAKELRRSLESLNPRFNRAGLGALLRFHTASTELRLLCMERIAEHPGEIITERIGPSPAVPPYYDEREAQALRKCMSALGNHPGDAPNETGSGASSLLQSLARFYGNGFDHRGFDVLLEATESGYLGKGGFAQWLQKNVKEEFAIPLIQMVVRDDEASLVLEYLPEVLGEDALPAIQGLYRSTQQLEADRRQELVGWVRYLVERTKGVAGSGLVVSMAEDGFYVAAAQALNGWCQRFGPEGVEPELRELLYMDAGKGANAEKVTRARSGLLSLAMAHGMEETLENVDGWMGHSYLNASAFFGKVRRAYEGPSGWLVSRESTVRRSKNGPAPDRRVCRVSPESLGKIWANLLANREFAQRGNVWKAAQATLRHCRDGEEGLAPAVHAISSNLSAEWPAGVRIPKVLGPTTS